MSYINKIQKGATEYDINDTRIPTPVASKILGTDNNGAMQWQDAPQSGGGTQLYKHVLHITPEIDGETQDIYFEVISNISTAVPTTTVEASYNALVSLYDNAVQMRVYSYSSSTNDGYNIPVIYADLGSSSTGVAWTFVFYHSSAESVLTFTFTTPLISDTVTAL